MPRRRRQKEASPEFTALDEALASPGSVTHVKVDREEDPSELFARMGEMTKLESLYIRCGLPHTVPDNLQVPAGLVELEVVVKELAPETEMLVAAFSGLQRLEIWGRHLKDQVLPSSIGDLSSLQSLELVSCGISDLPEDIAKLSSLKRVAIRGCPVKSFPNALCKVASLEELELKAELVSLPDELAQLQALRHLNLEGSLNKGLSGTEASHVRPIPSVIGKLTQLETLNLGQCGATDELDMLAPLTNLRVLDLSWGKTSDLSGLAPLKNLEELHLDTCYKVRDVEPLKALPNLRFLSLSSNHYIEDISGISGITSLKELNIEGCSDIESLAPILEHPTLEILHARDEVQKKWDLRQQIRHMPGRDVIEQNLQSEDFAVVASALEQLAAYIHLNSTQERSALASYFEIDDDPCDEEVIPIPVVDEAVKRWGSELPPKLLVGLARMGLASIIENYQVVLIAVEKIVERGEVDSQVAVAELFHEACEYYDTGHRFWSETVLDELIDTWFPKFHPKALAELLGPCGTDALNSDGGDAMEALFVAALQQSEQLDDDIIERLSDKFSSYAKDMIEYGHAEEIGELREEIRKVCPAAGAKIDEELQSAERGIQVQKWVSEAEGPSELVALLERMRSSEDEVTFEELDDVSEFSRLVYQHRAEVPGELLVHTLEASWAAGSGGWDWARILLQRFEADSGSAGSHVKDWLKSHTDQEKHVLSELKLAKQIRLMDLDGDPEGTDPIAGAVREAEVAVTGADPAEALQEELSTLLLRFVQGRQKNAGAAALGTLRRIAAQPHPIKTNWEHFSYFQMEFESHVRTAVHEPEAWDHVHAHLDAFAGSLERIDWGQKAIEIIAADGVASAQLSGRDDIRTVVFEKLIPDPVEKDRLAFNLACYYAHAGDKDGVLKWTKRALELGKAAAQFRDDDDFSAFREDADFLAVLDTVEG